MSAYDGLRRVTGTQPGMLDAVRWMWPVAIGTAVAYLLERQVGLPRRDSLAWAVGSGVLVAVLTEGVKKALAPPPPQPGVL